MFSKNSFSAIISFFGGKKNNLRSKKKRKKENQKQKNTPPKKKTKTKYPKLCYTKVLLSIIHYSMLSFILFFFFYLKDVLNIFMTEAVTNLVLSIVTTIYVIYNMVHVMHVRLDGWMRPAIQVR